MRMETCPNCGEILEEAAINDEANFYCSNCNYYANTNRELEKDRELATANKKIEELKDLHYQSSSLAGRQMAERDIKLVAAGADAERLAQVLMNTVNFFVGDTNVLAVLKKHEESAELYKTVGG